MDRGLNVIGVKGLFYSIFCGSCRGRRRYCEDLGFSPKEAKRLLAQTDAQIDESIRLKQQLMDEIAEWMKETSVTQAAAAEVLRVTRPRVSDVVNHKVEKFTIDALVRMLGRIGKRVRLAVQ